LTGREPPASCRAPGWQRAAGALGGEQVLRVGREREVADIPPVVVAQREHRLGLLPGSNTKIFPAWSPMATRFRSGV
jgi:hypothetical protein